MKKIKFLSRLVSIRTHFRTRMLAGFLIIIPLVLTYAILNSITSFLAETLEPAIKQAQVGPVTWLSNIPITIIALIFSAILLYIAGLIAETVIGRRVVGFGQNMVEKIPIVRPLYRVFRQTTDVFSGGAFLGSSRVVFLEYPKDGVLAMGLVTGVYKESDGNELLTIYIPTIPNPTSGFLAIVPKEKVTETSLTFEDAMKIVISAGVLTEEVSVGKSYPRN